MSSRDFAYALNGTTGEVQWSFCLTCNIDFSLNEPRGVPSPAIGTDGTVYFAAIFGTLFALNGTTGDVMWSFVAGLTNAYWSYES